MSGDNAKVQLQSGQFLEALESDPKEVDEVPRKSLKRHPHTSLLPSLHHRPQAFSGESSNDSKFEKERSFCSSSRWGARGFAFERGMARRAGRLWRTCVRWWAPPSPFADVRLSSKRRT